MKHWRFVFLSSQRLRLDCCHFYATNLGFYCVVICAGGSCATDTSDPGLSLAGAWSKAITALAAAPHMIYSDARCGISVNDIEELQ
jgi:hypothetical protein